MEFFFLILINQLIKSWWCLFKYPCITQLAFICHVQEKSLRVIVFPKCLTEIKLDSVNGVPLIYHSLTISKMEMSLVWHNSECHLGRRRRSCANINVQCE